MSDDKNEEKKENRFIANVGKKFSFLNTVAYILLGLALLSALFNSLKGG